MKKTATIIVALFMMLNLSVYSQGVLIDNGTGTVDGSAMLDVQSTTKGMLVPRMTTAQRTAISSPATGLLVFDNTTGSFWFYNGSSWEDLSGIPNQISDTDNDTKVQVEKNADDDLIRFDLAGTEHWKMTGARLEAMNNGNSVFIGEGAGAADDLSDNKNVFVGYNAGQANTTGQYNTAYGDRTFETNTTGNENTATGAYALLANTTGSKNTSTGVEALRNNTGGNYNTATGAYSLHANLTGSNNTATGYFALQNATQSDNTATGYEALKANTTGSQNTANGSGALQANTTGSENTATGYAALFTNITGEKNTAMGKWALYNATGSNNTVVGFSALTSVTTGNHLTAIGAGANSNPTLSNGTAIGAGATIFQSNLVILGNSAVSTIGGYTTWTSYDDGRFKINLKENVAGLDFIMKLRPLTYNMDMDAVARFHKTPDNLRSPEGEKLRAAEVQIGFIAQEVEEAATELGFDFHGVDKPKNENSHYGLRYAEFVVPLVKAMQEQQVIIEQQQVNIEKQQDLLSKYESTLEEMNNRMEMLEAKVSGQHSEKYVEVK